MEQQRHSSHSTAHASAPPPPLPPFSSFSKKSYNANGFTTSYDDVFGGPPKYGAAVAAAFTPRPEDYAEIFGCFRSSRASSIPILDLPPIVDDHDAAVSLNSGLDYSVVFSGFGEVDFAVPHDLLFSQQSDAASGFSEGGGEDDEDEEAWTPAASVSLSEESDPSACSERSECNQTELQQFFEGKTSAVSHNKVDLGSGVNMPNMIHVTEPEAVPGYSCVVDKAASSQKVDCGRIFSSVTDGADLYEDLSGNLSQGRFAKQTSSRILPGGSEMQSFGNNNRSVELHRTNGPMSDPTFVSVSDISLRTMTSDLPPPSRPPPLPAHKEGFFCDLTSGAGAPKRYTCEMTDDDNSSCFFDVEVDARSSAKSSAASMEDKGGKAQTRLNTAKETMVRKKDSHEICSKLGLEIETVSGGKVGMNGKGTWEDDRFHAAQREQVSGKASNGCTKAMPVLADLPEQNLNKLVKTPQKKHKKKASAVVDPVISEGAGKWKEATRYYEFIKNDISRTKAELPNLAETLVPDKETYQHCYSDGKKAAPEMQKYCDEGIKTPKSIPEQRENAIPSSKVNEGHVPEEHRQQPKSVKAAFYPDCHEKFVEIVQDVCVQVIGDHAETKFWSKADSRSTTCQRNILGEEGVKKDEKEPANAGQLANNENNDDEHSVGWEEYEGKLWESLQREEEIKANKARESEDDVRKFEETRPRFTKERNVKDPHKKGENEGMKKPYEMGENGGGIKDACINDDNQQMVQEANKGDTENACIGHAPRQRKSRYNSGEKFELVEKERALKRGIHGYGKKGLTQVSGTKGCGLREASERSLYDGNHGETDGLECSSMVFKVASNLEANKEHGQALEGEINKKEHEYDDVVKLPGIGEKLEVVYKSARDLRQFNSHSENEELYEKPLHAGELKATEDVDLVVGQKECSGELKGDLSVDRDNEQNRSQGMGLHYVPASLESLDGEFKLEKKTKLPKTTHKLENPPKTADKSEQMVNQGTCVTGTQQLMAGRKFEDMKMDNVLSDDREIDCLAEGDAIDDHLELKIGRVPLSVDIGEMIKKPYEGIGDEQTREKKMNASDPTSTEDIDHGVGGRIENVGDTLILFDQEENLGNSKPTHGLPGLCVRIKQNARGISEHSGGIGNVISETTADGKREEQLKKGKELGSGSCGKLEEERKREREKDRMTVDTGTCEANQKAALERECLEARQKAMSEARERLERACAEARDRSLGEKAIEEARLREQRAAVERATAEARQRAIEKAIAERATLQARERLERSFSGTYSSTPRAVEIRQSSSLSGAENYYGAGGDSSQRHKARSERQCRTANRMAKALAEKKMRDLVAQRELAERNKLAEILDAEVKRWSSGKEGNLRALLSTLQYILSPDSGWKPIPLTEVITAAAVKKAYRKATLYVHPDKLQQRGASVHEKYICEKVFDLLKDACNKFNSEER